MCILFLCAFRLLDYASSKRIDTTTTIIEGNETQYGLVFPSANLADAKRIKTRIETLDKLLEQIAEIQKKVNSNNPRLNITYEYKTPDKSEVVKNVGEYLYSTSSEQKFDFSISGEPLNQTIHVKIPVGERGPNGVTGDRGDSGDDGVKGDKGIVGNEGLLQCL